MPRIAIAPTQQMPDDVRAGTPNDYLESLRLTGAEWVMLDLRVHDPLTILDEVDGLMLLGGHDVDPSIYGEAPHPAFEPVADGRDAFELALARRAVAREQPLLAICRGLQVLNVALGGTLVQDIPTEMPGPLVHNVREKPWARLVHPVSVSPESRLAAVLGDGVVDGQCDVNSRHHQSVRALGDGLVVTAVSADGVIEAAEHETLAFCLGVQWHPENFWQTGRFSALFEAFVRAAGRQT
jgi:putative glutamine amidotransferase